MRWLLADEVGLGKTIEASLILNRLVHAGKVERCLVVAPDALTVQWLGELWRKYHQVFTLLDAQRLADVARDFGADFNPFDVHRRAVIALEMLTERPQLTDQAVAAGIDLLVVDEAQRLRRPPGHPGEPGWRAIAPIAGLGRHVLLLSATPLEDDAHGFFRLLQLLRPQEFPEDVSFEARLASATPLPPCTSSTRRADIGGLPPRVGIPIAPDKPAGWQLREAVEAAVRGAAAPHAIARRQKIDRVRRALASGAALGRRARRRRNRAAPPGGGDGRRRPARRMAAGAGAALARRGEKTLVFVAHRETLEMLRTALSHRAQLASGVFHEELLAGAPRHRGGPVPRSRVVRACSCPPNAEARVATSSSAAVSCCSTCRGNRRSSNSGSAGSIGSAGASRWTSCTSVRLGGIGADVVRLFEALGLFREPLAGLEPQLAHVEGALEEIALDPRRRCPENASRRWSARPTRRAHASAKRRTSSSIATRIDRRWPQASSRACPPELDALNEEVVVTACIGLGFTIERPRGRRIFAIELGNGALVDGLPGVPGGSSYVGSFDREEALEEETLDFFASGHPLVEGIFAHFEESAVGPGRAVRGCRSARSGAKDSWPSTRTGRCSRSSRSTPRAALGPTGRRRSASGRWARVLSPAEPNENRNWQSMVRRLGAQLEPARRPHAVAAIVVKPAR